ncbi:hypothetical protein ACN20G_33295 (plasmid) [Streptomyces sp. BI20]|uniref:hypothetical protein n=1 Tax=Streptomyces sp. BI20 TaxID=3403460 RepID=UPI003C73434B
MGALDFFTTGPGKQPELAFSHAVMEARHLHGHGGYTGSIAEKDEYEVVAGEPVQSEMDAETRAHELLREGRFDSKWGPAGAIPIDLGDGERGWLFFGVASY